jgi:C4-type Zn-finger protein
MLNRRSFIGWAIAACSLPKAKGKANKKEAMILGLDRCPICGDYMHLPKKAPDGYYKQKCKKVPITCSCRKCNYEITEMIWSHVIPRVQ